MSDMTLEQVRDLLNHAEATSLTGNYVQLSIRDCAHAYLALEAALATPAEPSIPVSKVREMIVKGYYDGYADRDQHYAYADHATADRILAEYAGAGK